MKESKKMKKIIALILAGLMILTLVACNTTPDVDDKNDDQVSDSESEAAPETTEKDITANVAIGDVAQALMNKYADFAGIRQSYDDYMASLPEDASEEDKNMTYETFCSYQLSVAPIEDMEYGLMGIPTLPEGISEVYCYQPMMMGQAFIGYVFRVAEGTDVEAFKKALEDNCDMRWNICTAANTVVTDSLRL